MNKRIMTIFLIAFFSISLMSTAFAAEKTRFDLTEVQEMVLKNSRAVKSMEERVKEVEAQKYIASNAYDSAKYGGYYNALNQRTQIVSALGATRTELEAEIAKGVSANADKVAALTYQLQILEMQAGQVSMAVGQGAAGSSQARKGYEAARDGLDDLKRAQEDMDQQIGYATKQLYTGILLLEAQSEYLEQNYDLLLKMLNVERIKKDLGISSDVEVERLASQAADLGRTVDQLKESLKLNKWTLNDMMGRELNAKLELTPVEVKPYLPIGTAGSYLEKAFAEVAFIPQLERDIENLKKDIDDLDGSNEIAVQEAKLKQTKLTLEDKKQELKSKITSLVNDVNLKGRAYQLAEYSLKTAQQEHEWNQIRYELGLIAKLQLDAAELSYQEALNNKTAAAYEYFLAKSALELAEQGIL